MNQRKPFPSLTSLRARHRRLLERRRENGQTADFFTEIETFIERGRATGVLLDTDSDRWQAQNLLDYWTNELYHARREAPDPTLVEFDPNQAPELDDELCPYLGLDPFGLAKHNFFFGRNLLIDEMVQHLKYNRFLAIVGPSGSGKSSAALAGLLPQLQAGALYDSKKWRYYPPIVPGSDPQANLARIVQPSDVDSDQWVQETAERIQQDPNHIVNLINKTSKDPAVFIIDQFEEIFTLCHHDRLRRAFINALLHLIQTPTARHTVILTMRTDFESNLVQIPALQAAYEQAEVRVTAMKAPELREAIEKPAELVGLKFEEGLVDELIREVLGEPAALPLLQFTLLKLWQTRDRNRVTWEAYHRLGGGRQALANSADAFFDSLSPRDQITARRILLGIVQPSAWGEIIRDRILLEHLYQLEESNEQIDRVLSKLLEARLVRLIEGNRPQDNQVELAHEALVRNWPRLVGWLEEERVAKRRRLRLATTAEQWQALDQDPSALLRGPLLQEALQYDNLNQLEQAFVQASVAAADRERLEEEAAQQRELEQARALAEAEQQRAQESARFAQRLSRFSVALAFVFVIAVVAALWAARNGQIARQNAATAIANEAIAEQIRVTSESSAATAVAARSTAQSDANLRATAEADARQQRDTAEQNAAAAESARSAAEASAREAESQSRLATARELAVAAVDQFDSDPQLGLLLALEAVNVTFSVDQTAPAEAEDALYRALQASQQQLTLSGHTDWVSDVAFSQDGTRIATAGFDTAVKVWDAASGQELLTLSDHGRAVNGVAFSPDGTRLATAGNDGFVIIWDTVSGQRLAVLNGENGAIQAIAYSPDGTLLATANQDATVRVWRTATRSSLFRLFGHNAALRDVTFSPDGTYFATAAEDGRVIVWDTETGASVFSLPPETDAEGEPVIINGLAFSPDGEKLITANDNGTAKIWAYQTSDLLATLVGHTSFVFDVAFSPDGAHVATASGDGTAKVWRADTGQASYTLSGHNGGVNAITFSADGSRIATASQDNTAKVWNAESGLDLLILSNHTAPVLSVAFNSEGTAVVTASSDRTAKVWDAATGQVTHTFTSHNADVRHAAFSPDGSLVATASDDWNARIWDVDSNQIQFPFLPHQGPVNELAFSPDGTWLATASDDGFARIWEVSSGQALFSYEHPQAVNGVAFHPEGNRLATASDDGTATIWDIETEQILLTLPGHEGPVNDVTFNQEGTLLATAGSDGTARIWNLRSGQLLHTLAGHTGSVLSVAFNPDSTRLATASVDKTAKLWDTASGQVLRTLLGHTSTIHDVDFGPGGLRLATASSDRTAQINEIDTLAELFQRAQEHVTRPLTQSECEQYLRGRPCLMTESP